MSRYVLREGLSMAMIPGAGRITKDTYLEGEYDAYVPGLLVEILDSTPPAPPPAQLLTEPRQETAPARESTEPERQLLTEVMPVDEDLEEEPKKKSAKSRRRKRGSV